MKKSSSSSRIKSLLPIFAVFIVITAMSAWFGIFALHGAGENVLTSSFADEEKEYDSYGLDVSSWTPHTYLNAPKFAQDVPLVLAGRGYVALGYTLATTSEEQYSMEAWLDSPSLFIPDNDFIFRFSFYTRMRASTPHEVILYAREEDTEFEKVGSVRCSATGDQFAVGEIAIGVSFTYLRLEIRTFYSYDSVVDTTDRGIYFLSTGFALVAESTDVYSENEFDFIYDQTEFVYNGQPQCPTVTVETDLYDEGAYAYDVRCYSVSDASTPVSSVHAGDYIMETSLRNRSNHVCFAVTKRYSIERATLTVRNIEYVANDNCVIVLFADVVDASDREIYADELQLGYFTSTQNGRRTDSDFPVLSTPTDAFSVGITVGSDDFYTPTENTFVSVDRSFGTNAVFSIEKNLTYTYCGKEIDILDGAFFADVAGTPVDPSAPVSVEFFDRDGERIEEDGIPVSKVKSAGTYEAKITYLEFVYTVTVTVEPRPVVAFLYSGADLIKYYDGTTDLFDREQDSVLTRFATEDLTSVDDPDFAGEDGFIRTAEVSDVVTLQYKSVSFARAIGNTYIVLNEPVLIGTNASDYYLHPDLHVIASVKFGDGDFEKSGSVLTRTEDVYYQDGKEYVHATFTKVPSGSAMEPGVTYYERSGSRYFPTEDEFFSEKDYYTVVMDTIVNNVLSILPTQIIFVSDMDDSGRAVTCRDKTYSPDDYTADHAEYYYPQTTEPTNWITAYGDYFVFRSGEYVPNTSTVWRTDTYYYRAPSDADVPIYGNEPSVPYLSFSFSFTDCNVGRHPLTVTLSDKTLYDRYLPEVVTPVTLYGNIVPAHLTADVSRADEFIDRLTKTYDGNAVATPVFTDLILQDGPADFPSFDRYKLTYSGANYTGADVGNDIGITIGGIRLEGLTASILAYLSNYVIDPMTVRGAITPKELVIYSESLRIYEKQTPIVSSNAESDEDLNKRIYADRASAEAGGASIKSTETTSGNYFLRIDSRSANYTLPAPGYKILPMVVISDEKTGQKIVFPGLDLSSGKDFTVLVGSKLSLSVLSVEEDLYEDAPLATGLAVDCVLSDPDGVFDIDGDVWTATRSGIVTLTASQAGNRYYYEAEDVTLTFRVVSDRITGETDATGLYSGDSLPVLSSYSLTYKGETPRGNLTPSDETVVASERGRSYTYYFTSDPELTSFVADFSITDTYYVPSGVRYEPASGSADRLKKYFLPAYTEQSVVVGQAIPRGQYYEYKYKRVEENVYLSGKTYYESIYAQSTVITDDVVPAGVYYEKTEGRYYQTTDTSFMPDKTYYVIAYTIASVIANERIEGAYYELDDTVYVLTEDETFVEGKDYYTAGYVVSGGSGTIPGSVRYFEKTPDVYTLTADHTFDGDKTYYRIVYLPVSVAEEEIGSAILQPRFEPLTTEYYLTYDYYFETGKKYYVKRFERVYFAFVGDEVDPEIYCEIDQGTPIELTEEDNFEKDKEYRISVWTEGSTTPGEPIPADTWYEKISEYFLTTDVTFVGGKTYFVRLYTSVGYVAGEPITETLYEMGPSDYRLTTDTEFAAGKTYYRRSYTEAVVTVGDDVRGREYYEARDRYLLQTGGVFEDKTYYTRAYVDVTLLQNTTLPSGYFRSVTTYVQTDDTVIDREKIYYTVSYQPAEVAPGTNIYGEYYRLDSGNYVRATERYFRYECDYYKPVYIPQKTLQRYKIDPFDCYYYPAEGVYLADKEYFVFDGTDMVVDDNVEIGSPVGSRHYVMVEDEEFVQGRRYYCISYPFIGQVPVQMLLTAQRPVVTVYTKGESSSVYGESTDLYDLVEGVTIQTSETRYMTYDEWTELTDMISFELKIGSSDGIESFSAEEQALLPPGAYTIENNQRESYTDEVVFLKMIVTDESLYTIELAAGTTTHTVKKATVTVAIPEQQKYYGEGVPNDRYVLNRLRIDGCDNDLADNIRDNLTVSVQAYSYSQRGQYPIHLQVKDLVAVGTAIPEGVYYRYDEITSSYLTVSGVFEADKEYYILVYKEESVTVGEEIDLNRYFILNNSTYIHPEENTFKEGVTYYVLDYALADIYQNNTLSNLENYYNFVFVHGYLSVVPISVSVGATSAGHDYGNNKAEITPRVTILSNADMTEEERNRLYEEILVDISTYCDVSSASDSGEYPIEITYNGKNANVQVVTERDCLYPVHYAKLNANEDAPSFTFNDVSVLYDGKLHTITVSYNTRLWEDVTIVYDKGSFSEVGNYLYTATVSKKNYEDLTLTATMSIGTLSIRSSNRVNNAVTVVITDPTCYSGINGDYTVLMRKVSDEERLTAIDELISAVETKEYTVKGVYSLTAVIDSVETTLGFSSYTVTVVPSGLEYKEGLQLYGYSQGKFQPLEYTYSDGSYTFSVSSNLEEDSGLDPLAYIAFAEVKERNVDGVQYKWLFIVIIGAVMLLILGIVVSAVSGSGKVKGRSKKRHQRWV